MADAAHENDPLKLRLVGAGYRGAWALTRALPEAWAYAAFDAVAQRQYRTNERLRERLRSNFTPVVGEAVLEETVYNAFRCYARYWCETFRMQDLSRTELARRFRTEGIENIEKAHAAGAGGILATMHVGNWDAGGRWVAERWPLTVVAEVLRPRALFERFLEHRRSLGMQIIPLVSGADVTAQCESHIRAGRLVALLADRALGAGGVEVDLFGRRARMPAGAAVLALRTGAPLIPAVIFEEPRGEWLAWVMEPVAADGAPDDREAVSDVMQRLAQRFERYVLRAPSQWYAMFQRYWLD
jgi:KDO2-lipid IV(A) lauroyltransferase